MTERGGAQVLDFGLARRFGTSAAALGGETASVDAASLPGVVAGTPGYTSPEQLRGEELDARTDLFSLGAVLYEMATGREAFPGDSSAVVIDAILNRAPEPPSKLNPDLPPLLEEIIAEALEKDRELRVQSAAEVRAALRRLKRDLDSARAAGAEAPPSVAAESPRSTWSHVARAAGALVVAGALAGLWSMRTAEAPPAPIEITPLTADGGLKRLPQLSPDGETVAYSWNGPNGENWDVYVKALGLRTEPVRLTDDPAEDRGPVWSPDGHQLVFFRVSEEGAALYTIPALGGREQKLTDIDVVYPYGLRATYWRPQLAWSPDGEWLAVAVPSSEPDGPDSYPPVQIDRIGLATLERHPLTTPHDGSYDVLLAVSPDAARLAFVRQPALMQPGAIWVRPVDEGTARRITPVGFATETPAWHGLAWTPDGREVVFTATRRGVRQTFRVSSAGGTPQPIAGLSAAYFPSIRQRRLVYEERRDTASDIWRVPARPRVERRAPERFIASSRPDYSPAYSADGHRIAFGSMRSGASNIWLAGSDGSDPVQLTELERETGMPRWSPDGRWIAFDSHEEDSGDIFVVEAEGGTPRRLTSAPSLEFNPSWSRDGQWIYFGSSRTGSDEIWKVPARGGPAVQVTYAGGFDAAESPDGRDLYYSKGFFSGVWRMPVAGGEETLVVSGPLAYKAWALGRDGLYFATFHLIAGTRSRYEIRHLNFDSGEVSEVYRQEGAYQYGSLAVSPDEEWVLFTAQPEEQSELVLVENFR